ncbi:MAG: insulinase family protein, partial [Nonlabens ulvanivorans]
NVFVIKWTDMRKSFYDTETGLLVGLERMTMTPQGPTMSVTQFSDYKDYSGVKFPTSMVIPMMGQEITFELKDLKVNPGLKDSDF